MKWWLALIGAGPSQPPVPVDHGGGGAGLAALAVVVAMAAATVLLLIAMNRSLRRARRNLGDGDQR